MPVVGPVSNGKGDSPRPKAVDADTFAARWAQTFGGRRYGKREVADFVCAEAVARGERVVCPLPPLDAPAE